MMTWEQARANIIRTVVPGLKLDDDSDFKVVVKVKNDPSWVCWVSVGAANTVRVSEEMLQDIFNAVVKEKGIYYRNIVPRKHRQLVEDKGAYVHVIGSIFYKSGISGDRERGKYRFL